MYNIVDFLFNNEEIKAVSKKEIREEDEGLSRFRTIGGREQVFHDRIPYEFREFGIYFYLIFINVF